MSENVFACERVSYTYPGASAPAVSNLGLTVAAGSLTAVIGPNGAGKSTLVRLLSGTLTPTAGSVGFRGRAATEWKRTDLARQLAVVAQEPPPVIPQTVTEYVSLGRNPYVSPWSQLGPRDHEIVASALLKVGLEDLAGRRLTDLSGGEVQRAKLARALAQEPEVLVLDEPTAHLDIGHAFTAFEDLEKLVSEGITVFCVTHDINLASRFADDLVLLSAGAVERQGPPDDVLTAAVLGVAYSCAISVKDLGNAGRVAVPVAGVFAS